MTTSPPVPEPDPSVLTNAPAESVEQVPNASLAPRSRRRPWILPAATGVLGLVLGAGGMSVVSANRAAAADAAAVSADQAAQEAADKVAADAAAARVAVLTDAVAGCGLKSATGIGLGDGGTSLTFDMKGNDENSGAAITDITCLFMQLDMPSGVTSHIEQTTSMDGRQTETWDNVTVSWSYHPDRGLDGVLTVADS